MKITSLVAVLVLCCAGLAGSAYAYTATYVDTLDDQPIENVYVTINGSKDVATYGTPDLDLDVEYNFLSKIVNNGTEEDPVMEREEFYNMLRATVNNASPGAVENVSAAVSDNVATFTINLFTFKLEAFGDKVAGSLVITGFPATDFDGATVTYKVGEAVVGPADDGSLTISGITLDPEERESVPSSMDIAVTMIVTIDTIDTSVDPVTLGEGETLEKYYPLKKDISNSIIIEAGEFTARFSGEQA